MRSRTHAMNSIDRIQSVLDLHYGVGHNETARYFGFSGYILSPNDNHIFFPSLYMRLYCCGILEWSPPGPSMQWTGHDSSMTCQALNTLFNWGEVLNVTGMMVAAYMTYRGYNQRSYTRPFNRGGCLTVYQEYFATFEEALKSLKEKD